MATDKKQTAMRFTETGKRLLEKLAQKRGISQSAVMEQLVRDEAARQGIRDDYSSAERPEAPNQGEVSASA